MNKKFTRLCAMLLALVMAMSFGVSALDYGQEWAGASGSSAAGYADVPANHWAWDSIQRVSAKNWFGGYPDGTFRPNGTITRAEALKVFVVFLGLQVSPVSQTGFYDVAANAWYAPYVEAGKDLFPVRTTVQGKTPFQPDMPVTREDTVYALVNALGYGNDMDVVDQSVLNMFKDQNSISRNLRPYFAVALKNQLVSGYTDGTIRAQNSLTRAEFATLLYRGSFVGHNDSFTAKISSVTPFPNGATNMAVGETLTLSARAAYTDGTNQAYTDLQPYIASGSDVISLSGISVTALKEGTATIGFNDSHLKAQTITITVKAPTDVPVLKITDYVATTEAATVSVAGTVSDANLSTLSLTCGGKDIIPGSNGSFQTVVSLNVGVNTITFVATNQYGVTAQRSITITRTEVQQPQNDQNAQTPPAQDNTQNNQQNNTQPPAQDAPQNNQTNNQQNNTQNNQQPTQPAVPTGAIDLTMYAGHSTNDSWIIKDLSQLTVQVGTGKNTTYNTYKNGIAFHVDFFADAGDAVPMFFEGRNTLTFTVWTDYPCDVTVYAQREDADKADILDTFTLKAFSPVVKTYDITGFHRGGIVGKKDFWDGTSNTGTLKIFEPVAYDR